MVMALKVRMDRQGRVVIPKQLRERYGLLKGGELELIAHEGAINLLPLVEEEDPAVTILSEPCKSGDPSRHGLVFSREKVWER